MKKVKRRTLKQAKPKFFSTTIVIKRLKCDLPLALAWARLNGLCKVAAAYVWTDVDIEAFAEDLKKAGK